MKHMGLGFLPPLFLSYTLILIKLKKTQAEFEGQAGFPVEKNEFTLNKCKLDLLQI